jgi:hypothetical protein
MEQIFNLEALREEINGESWEKTDDWTEERQVYLGTVFSLYPSGKFYMPWACSNVAGDCTVCNGTGYLKNHKRNRVVKRALKRWDEMCKKARQRGTLYAITKSKLRAKADHIARSSCPHCGATGSRSAHLDEIWREQAEEELSSIGLCLISGEGDPCDLFAYESREIASEDDSKEEDNNVAI